MRVGYLAQEHNAMSLARARTWSTCSGVESTNHKATAPLAVSYYANLNNVNNKETNKINLLFLFLSDQGALKT